MEKVTFEEFRDEIWDTFVSDKVVSCQYMAENEEFINSLTYDAYRLYTRSNVEIKIFGKTFEILFFNLFKFKGANYNIEDDNIEF